MIHKQKELDMMSHGSDQVRQTQASKDEEIKAPRDGLGVVSLSPRADPESAVRSLFGKEREEGQGNEDWDRDRRQGIKSTIKTAATGANRGGSRTVWNAHHSHPTDRAVGLGPGDKSSHQPLTNGCQVPVSTDTGRSGRSQLALTSCLPSGQRRIQPNRGTNTGLAVETGPTVVKWKGKEMWWRGPRITPRADFFKAEH